jgi:hypothetical protein
MAHGLMLQRLAVDSGSVASVPRPLIALLLGTVVFFALWMTALKPSGGGKGHPGLGRYQPAIKEACSVPGLSHPVGCGPTASRPSSTSSGHAAPPASRGAGAAGASAGRSAASGGSATQGHSPPAQKATTGKYVQPALGAQAGFAAVEAGLREHRVLALLFYNPSAADDQAVHQELSSVSTHHGEVVKLAVPLQYLFRYSTLLNEVPVNFSPTLVLINRARQANEIAGFADSFEIDQRVADALKSHS